MMEIPQALACITLTDLLCVICYTYISAGMLTANHFPGGCSSDARVFLGLQQTHMESQLLEQQLQQRYNNYTAYMAIQLPHLSMIRYIAIA